MLGLRLQSSTAAMRFAFASSAATRARVASPFVAAQARYLGTIPQPPGNIVGTVNDAVPVPPAHKTHGSYHWDFEKLVLLGIVPLSVAPSFTGGSLTPVLDATLGSLVLVHAQLGLESCIIDYIPKRVYGSIHNLAIYALYAGTIVGLVGLYEYETNDIGITETIKKVWNA